MGVTHSQDSAFAKEMTKHEATHTQYGPPGRPYVYYPLPTMMYRAGRVNDGPIGILDKETASSEAERTNLESRGFVAGGQVIAIKAFEDEQQELAVMAAVRNFEDQHMSDKAKAEIDAHEASTSEHVPEIPATPIKSRK